MSPWVSFTSTLFCGPHRCKIVLIKHVILIKVSSGGNMRKLNKAVFAITSILSVSFVLVTTGCADSGGGNSANNINMPVNQNGDVASDDTTNLQPTKPELVRECSNNEFAQLISWRNSVNAANKEIDSAQGKKVNTAVQASLTAIRACDSRFAYHKQQACKKVINQNVITPKGELKVYDAYLINRDCQKVETYLTKFEMRPDKTGSAPIPTEPQPLPVDPQPLNPPVIDNGGSQGSLDMCSQDEFARLNEWSKSLDKSDKSIAKLGGRSNWKYDSEAIASAALATKSCESLIKYHSSRTCEKNAKQYTRETLSDRCKTTRSYFYEYVQNKETLIFPNAELYVDLSYFAQQRFEAQSFATLGSCVVENRTDNVIDYSGRKALVTETRGFEQKMMVLITAEGLKIDCYGLDIDGPFSKTQVVKLLKAEGTDIRLEYRLK